MPNLETTVHNPGQRAPHRPGFRKTTCRECGESFQDISGHQLCDACLVENINGAGILELDDDDLFARPPRSARRPALVQTARRQCRGDCNLTYVVALDYDGPPLCDGCRADLDATRARIQARIDKVLAQMDSTLAIWEAAAAKSPRFWASLEDALDKRARGEMTEAELSARWRKRYYDPDPAWRELLKAYEDRECALAALAAERARLERALAELP